MKRVDIVIVNWNAGQQLQECIASIFANENEALSSVTVVDNASCDRSAEFVRSDERVRLIEPGRNLGFGTACNLGAAAHDSDYILLLNPDTRLLRPTLAALVEIMERPESRSIGVCGIRLIGDDGATARHCARLPSPGTFFALSAGLSKVLPGIFKPVELTEFDHAHDSIVPHVMGAFFLVRRQVFEAVGGFDPAFFVFYEDLDLSLRIAQQGHSTLYHAGQSVYHRTGGTSGGAKAKALSYLLESRLIYARKHYGVAGRMLIWAGVFLVEPLRRTAQAIASGSTRQIGETFRAYRRVLAMLAGRSVDRG